MNSSIEIEYVRFQPWQDARLLSDLANCYREVFGDEPWNEWKYCRKCNTKFGRNDFILEEINFRRCDHDLVDFWPVEVVISDILEEVTAETSCWLAINSEGVIGFCWGYPITPWELEKKLELPYVDDYIKKVFGDVPIVAYQDELGLKKQYRNLGIAKEMFKRRLEDFRKQGLSLGVVRTKTNPPTVTYKWFTRMGYQLVAEYGDQDGRVILARTLFDLQP